MENNTEYQDNNLQLILSFFNKHKGQFVISDKVVYRFIGIATDEWDYYWVLYNGKKVLWVTCLSNLIPLKESISDKDYNMMVNISKLNDFDQVMYWGHKNLEEDKVFREQHIKEVVLKDGKDSRYMTDLEWNIF